MSAINTENFLFSSGRIDCLPIAIADRRFAVTSRKKKMQRPTQKITPAPPPPPARQFKTGFFGTTETKKSIQNRRDYEMFMKGYRYAHGAPNIPLPGDYV